LDTAALTARLEISNNESNLIMENSPAPSALCVFSLNITSFSIHTYQIPPLSPRFMFWKVETTYRRKVGPLAVSKPSQTHTDQKVARSTYAEGTTYIWKLGSPLGPMPVQSQTEQPLPTHQMRQKLSVRPTEEVDADGNLPDADAL
jgi:hypothetical protein